MWLKLSYVLNIIDEYKNLTVKINERRVDKNAFENLKCYGISLLHTQKKYVLGLFYVKFPDILYFGLELTSQF